MAAVAVYNGQRQTTCPNNIWFEWFNCHDVKKIIGLTN